MIAVTLIGPVSSDSVRIAGQAERHQPGGAVYYAGMALRALGVPVHIITRAALADASVLLAPLRQAGAAVTQLPSRETTRFINIYGPGTDERRQQVSGRADPFTLQDLPPIVTPWVYFAPLLSGDISPALIIQMAQSGQYRIALDAQGMLRGVKDGTVYPQQWDASRDVLPYIDILKADAAEAALLTGQSDAALSARILCGHGADHALVTLGNSGAALCHRGALLHVPAYRPTGKDWPVMDTTGSGDTYLAAYLSQILRGESFGLAGRFAAAAAALKLTAYGPLRADMAQIRRLL